VSLTHIHGNRVLDLAAGTGRLAIPLAEAGCDVGAIDISPEMLSVLRSKYTQANLRPLLADMADLAPFDLGKFDVVVMAFNSVYHLMTPQRQFAAIKSAADHLAKTGVLVVETSDPSRIFPPKDRELRFARQTSRTNLAWLYRSCDRQLLQVHGLHMEVGLRGLRFLRYGQRYLSLDELDTFSLAAGLQPCARWGSWAGRPRASDDQWSISLYRLWDTHETHH
jgi:SAM-dependent methyltransferase